MDGVSNVPVTGSIIPAAIGIPTWMKIVAALEKTISNENANVNAIFDSTKSVKMTYLIC